MKKLLISLVALLMLVGCSNNSGTTATTEPVETPVATETTEESTTVAVEDLYAAFVESYYGDTHKSDYYASGSPYVFVDGDSADLKLIAKKFACEAMTEDQAKLDSLQEIQAAATEEFATIVKAVAPTYDETVSFDNNQIVLILKDAKNNMCYFAADGTMKIVMGDARGTYRITEEEINSVVEFLETNLANVEALGLCA